MSWAQRIQRIGRRQVSHRAESAEARALRRERAELVAQFRAASLREPTPHNFARLAEALYNQGDIARAERAMLRAHRLSAGDLSFNACVVGALIAARTGQYHRAEMMLSRALWLDSSSPIATYLLGSLLAYRGALVAAQRLFRRDVPVMTANGNPTYTRVLCVDAAIPPGAEAVVPGMRRFFAGSLDATDSRPVYLVAADSVYFLRYARPLLQSLRLSGAALKLYVHLVNPSDEALDLAQSLASSSDDIAVSCEETALDKLSPDQCKTYFSCARYLALPDVLASVSTPVIVADIDQMLIGHPGRFLSLANAHDISVLRFDEHALNILSLVSATVMLVAPNADALSFSETLRARVLHALKNTERLAWHLDQALLALTCLDAKNVRIGKIPPAFVHLTEDEPALPSDARGAVFWSITNSIARNLQKLETASFSRFFAR